MCCTCTLLKTKDRVICVLITSKKFRIRYLSIEYLWSCRTLCSSNVIIIERVTTEYLVHVYSYDYGHRIQYHG